VIRPCAIGSCPEPAAPGKSQCVKHAAEQRKQNRTVNNSFYASKPWRLSRRAYLFKHPLCEFVLPNGETCGEIADSVHHRVPIEDGGARRDEANMMAVCRPHHSVIHTRLKPSARNYG
jgi:5-methylcytosine-specific restriction endonuclease McrA